MLEFVKTYFSELLKLSNEMSPYLLLGFVFAGLLHVYIKQEHTYRFLGKNNVRSVVNAALLGVPLPLCSCGVIPTGVSLSKNGASKGAAVSFLISTPQTGVDSILVTYSMLGLPFAILRPIVAFVTGIFGGILTNSIEKKRETELPAPSETSVIQTKSKISRFFNYAFVEFLQDIALWLIIGLSVAALISVMLPNDFFTTYIDSPLLNMLIVLALAVPIYVCATGSVPIAAVLMMKGLSPGAALVFLMAGPATNAATITVLGKSLGKKTLLAYLASITIGALAFGLIIDYLFPLNFFTNAGSHNHNHEHQMLPEYVGLASTIVLTVLIIHGYFRKYFIKTNNSQETITDMNTIKINVTGMNCNHCQMNVEKNVGKIEGIKSIKADFTQNVVEISGDNIDLKKVEETVNGLGYEYKGIIDN